MKRGANDPSHHSFNGHTRRALGTTLQCGSMEDVGRRRGMDGGEEGKKKTGGEVQHMCVDGWGGSTQFQVMLIYWKLKWEAECASDDFSECFYALVFSSCDLDWLRYET